MGTPRSECLDEAELTAFLLGELGDAELDSVADHLEACPVCEKLAQQFDELTDPAVLALRRSNPDSATFSGNVVEPTSSGEWPTTVGDYVIIDEIGRGGMGVVFRAKHAQLGRTVALKMMLGGPFGNAEFRRRFRVEAEAVARLQHPNIVQLFEIGEYQANGGSATPYFTLEYLEGGTLADLVGMPHPPTRVAEWLESLAGTVQYAHERGIVHRDLKPANVLRTADGELKITDFGVAKVLEETDDRTQTGMIVGTAEYMAPEQADGTSTVGPSADIYALGTLMYALLTGSPPFRSANVLTTLDQVRLREPIPPRQLQPDLPRDLETICLKCLAKEPRHRYDSAGALARDLRAWLDGRPIVARPASSVEKAVKWARRHPLPATLAICLTVVTVLGFVLVTWKWREALEQRKLADDRLVAETNARAGAQQARRTAEQERDRARTAQYAIQLTLAQREQQDGFVGRAPEVLAETAPDLRGWEYHYLERNHRQRVRTLDPQGERRVAFSPSGKLIAWVRVEPSKRVPSERIQLCEMPSGKATRLLEGHLGKIWDLAFSPDGRFLGSAGADKVARIWNVGTGQLVHTLIGHSKAVTRVEFSPDGKHLATLSFDNRVKLWNAATGESVHTFASPGEYSVALAFDGDGSRLVVGSAFAKRAQVWETKSERLLQTFAGHSDSLYRRVVLELGRAPRDFLGWMGSADGTRVAIPRGQTVTIEEPTSGKTLLRIQNPVPFVHVAMSPDNRFLASVNDGVKLWHLDQLHEAVDLRSHIAPARSLEFSPNGKYLASGGEDYLVKLWDVSNDKLIRTFVGHKRSVDCVAFHPDGSVLATASSDRTIKLWNVETGALLETFDGLEKASNGMVFLRDGKRLVTCGVDGIIDVRSAATGRVLLSLKGHRLGVRSLALSPDGKFLASGGHDRMIRLWNLQTGQTVHTLRGHSKVVWDVAFGPEGRTLASASWDNTVRVWDTTTGRELLSLEGHRKQVYGVAVTPDGKRVISSSQDNTVKVWDRATGQLMLTLTGHTQGVLCVAVSPDGRTLASSGDDLAVKLWKAGPSP